VLATDPRQNPELAEDAAERTFIRAYRYAVKAASAGRIDESFDRLDRIGCIREIGDADRLAALTEEYLESTARGDQTLVVAQLGMKCTGPTTRSKRIAGQGQVESDSAKSA